MNKQRVARCLPPLKPLRAFALVSATNSFTEAGKCMHLSQSAISSQIKKLEDHLGVELFERKPNRLYLTEVGKRYVEQVERALEILNNATSDIINYQKYVDVNLQVPDALIPWLNSRLGGFKRVHPYVRVSFQKLGDTLFFGGSADMAIMHQHWDKIENDSDCVARDCFELTSTVGNKNDTTHWNLVYLRERISEEPIRAFREWLLQEVERKVIPLMRVVD